MPATKATVRKRTAKKATKRTQRRPKKAVPRKATRRDARQTPSRRVVEERTPAIRESKMIGVYLEQCRSRPTERQRTGVALGALKGFPQFTADPDVIEKAANVLEAKMPTTLGAIRALRLQQRILDLRDAAAELRGRSNGDGPSPRGIFVEYGAAWAEKYGIGYRAFRTMGVPAKVLKEAGIST